MLTVMLLFSVSLFAGCGDNGKLVLGGGGNGEDATKINQFYDAITQSQTKLDTIADDIYRYWYDAIYNDKYAGNINLAIEFAQSENSDNIAFVKSNQMIIQSLYKEVRDSKYSSEIKVVMNAYSSYYEFVVNVSGSFNSYSSNKETLKKDLANALKRLSLEI